MTILNLKAPSENRTATENHLHSAEHGGDCHLSQKKPPTSYFETLVNLLKGNIGSGVFALGEAFKFAGIIVAPIMTCVIAAACLYCEHILLSCSTLMKEKKKLSYYPGFAETVQLGFAEGPKCFRIFSNFACASINGLIIVMQLGFCCVYILFISNTSKQMFDSFGFHYDLRLHMILTMVPLVLTSMIRSLKFIAPLSFIANIFIGFGIISTMYIILQDLPSISSRPAVADITTIPLFFGTALYSFEGIGLVLPLKSEMKKPVKFDSPFGVLNVGIVIILLIFLMLGFFSYLKYGEDIAASVTLNLPQEDTLSRMVRIAIAIGILFTFTLMFYVPLELIWPYVDRKLGPFKHPTVMELGVRVVFVFITFFFAEVIPHLGLFISLIGSFCSAFLSLVVPILCDTSVRWPSNFGCCKWRLIINLFGLFLSMIGVVSGTYYSLKAIVLAFIGTPEWQET